MPAAALLRVLCLGAALLAACRGSARAAPGDACPHGRIALRLLRSVNQAPTSAELQLWEQANPCIGIEISEVPFAQLGDKINVLASSRNPPDILVYDGPNTKTYAASGMLLPLDGYISASVRADILPATRAEHSYDGKLYSPGLQQTADALVYNVAMLDAIGITPPTTLADAWTWPQAIAVMRRCQQGTGDHVKVWGLAPSRAGSGLPGNPYLALLFLRSAGDPAAPPGSSAYNTFAALSPDGRTVDGYLNTPEAITGAQLYQDIFDKYRISPKTGNPTALPDGKACFAIENSQFFASILKDYPNFRWGITPLPYIRTPIVHTGSFTLGVTAKTRHPAESARFVIALSTGRFAAMRVATSFVLPATHGLYGALPALHQLPLSLYAEEVDRWGQPRPSSVHFAQYDKLVGDALRDIAYGSNPKTRLDALVRELQAVLRQ